MKRICIAFLYLLVSHFLFPEESDYSFAVHGSIGWLWSSKDFSVPVCTAGASFAARHSADSFFCIDGGYVSLSSDYTKLSSKAHGGYFQAAAQEEKLGAHISFCMAHFPNDTHIADGKPRFVLSEIALNALGFGLSYEANEVFRLGVNALAFSAGSKSGDLYYFFGNIDVPHGYGGAIDLSLPFGIRLSAGGVFASFCIETNEERTLGEGTLNSFFMLSKKTVELSSDRILSLALAYGTFGFDGAISVTSKTQTYAFFPYTYLNARTSGFYHFMFAGGDYTVLSRFSELNVALGYALCVTDDSSADYDYRYKKTLLFDGSSDSGDFGMPSFARSGCLLGNIRYSLTCRRLFRCEPTLSFQKLLVFPLLSERTRSYFSQGKKRSTTSLSSRSFSLDADTVRMIFLSGLSLSLTARL